MNALALFLYLLITFCVTVYVGKTLFTNGRYFLLKMFMDQAAITDAVNRILLTGYYLVNLGYVSIMLTVRTPVVTPGDLVASLCTSVGRIMLTLGVMHFINITLVVMWNKVNSKNQTINL